MSSLELAPGGPPDDAAVKAARLRAGEIRSGMEEIERTGRRVCLVLAEAHAQRDWLALGHRTFPAYVEAELGTHRSQAYRLLEHAKILEALGEAAGIGPAELPELAERVTRRIRRQLPAISDTVRARVSESRQPDRPAIVAAVVHEAAAVPKAALSPAGDSAAGGVSIGRAARALVAAVEKNPAGSGDFPAVLVAAIDAALGADAEARHRWADHLADTADALRRTAGPPSTDTSPRPARRPAGRASRGVPAGQGALWGAVPEPYIARGEP